MKWYIQLFDIDVLYKSGEIQFRYKNMNYFAQKHDSLINSIFNVITSFELILRYHSSNVGEKRKRLFRFKYRGRSHASASIIDILNYKKNVVAAWSRFVPL